MELTPAAAGANVYGDCITVAHWDLSLSVYVCTNWKKMSFSCHRTFKTFNLGETGGRGMQRFAKSCREYCYFYCSRELLVSVSHSAHNILLRSFRNTSSTVPRMQRMPSKAKRLNLVPPQNMVFEDLTQVIRIIDLEQQQVFLLLLKY